MNMNVAYHDTGSLFLRFHDHAKLGLANDLGADRPGPNLCESAGDKILDVASLPIRGMRAIARKMEDPRYVTVGLTALALVANSALFYPDATRRITEKAVDAAVDLISKIQIQHLVRPAAYMTTCLAITGAGLRAEGRFTNSELMQRFYGVTNVDGNPAGMTHAEIIANKA